MVYQYGAIARVQGYRLHEVTVQFPALAAAAVGVDEEEAAAAAAVQGFAVRFRVQGLSSRV